MTEFNITNETGSPIVFTTLDNFSLPAATTKDMFAQVNGDFSVSDVVDNEELQALIDATDISIVDENATAITDLFILSSLLAGGINKIDFITVTQAVDLDSIEIDTATNNAKVSNVTHTGEVTGSGSLTVDATAISNKSSVTAASGMEVLVNDSGNLKKVDASDFLSESSVQKATCCYFGGKSDSIGKFLIANGKSSDPDDSSKTKTRSPIVYDGTLTKLAYQTKEGTSSTRMKIHINGSVEETVTLSNINANFSGVETISVSVVEGDYVEIEYDGDDKPGECIMYFSQELS